MKTLQLLQLLAIPCAVVALAGCASSGRQITQSAGTTAWHGTAPSYAAEPAPRSVPSPEFDARPAIPDELNQSRPGPVPDEKYSALGGKGDERVSLVQSGAKAQSSSPARIVFGDPDPRDDGDFAWDKGLFRQQGWRLLSIHF